MLELPLGGVVAALDGGEVGAEQMEMEPGSLADVVLERRGQEPVSLVEATQVDEVLGGIADAEQAMGELDPEAPAGVGARVRRPRPPPRSGRRPEQARQVGDGVPDPLRMVRVLRDGERLAQQCEPFLRPAEHRGAQAQ